MAYCKIHQFSIDNLHYWSTLCKIAITLLQWDICYFSRNIPAAEWVIYNIREHLNSGAYRLVVYGSLAGYIRMQMSKYKTWYMKSL